MASSQVDRLMDMIINSLYSNREIFLRELISNASDALDKMRYTSIQDQSALGGNADLEVRVRGFPEDRKIVIECEAPRLQLVALLSAHVQLTGAGCRDTGIGMSRQEMLDSLGTIARSGTARFAAVRHHSGALCVRADQRTAGCVAAASVIRSSSLPDESCMGAGDEGVQGRHLAHRQIWCGILLQLPCG